MSRPRAGQWSRHTKPQRWLSALAVTLYALHLFIPFEYRLYANVREVWLRRRVHDLFYAEDQLELWQPEYQAAKVASARDATFYEAPVHVFVWL